jgi:molybdopterin biosynthesis enzyme
LGLGAELPLRARLAADVAKPRGLRCFFKARWECKENGSLVTALKGQPSFMIRPLVEANAWVVLAEDGAKATAGDWVDVYPLGVTA